jgi:hypothetical protein
MMYRDGTKTSYFAHEMRLGRGNNPEAVLMRPYVSDWLAVQALKFQELY